MLLPFLLSSPTVVAPPHPASPLPPLPLPLSIATLSSPPSATCTPHPMILPPPFLTSPPSTALPPGTLLPLCLLSFRLCRSPPPRHVGSNAEAKAATKEESEMENLIVRSIWPRMWVLPEAQSKTSKSEVNNSSVMIMKVLCRMSVLPEAQSKLSPGGCDLKVVSKPSILAVMFY